ncbi:interleukin-1 receptor-like 2 isoform X1 [Corythoichthys intestinalis]|uniref:interleukin-1 receptor-like 2 isoform X1 n=2 Tax=Corythoichthys intestinalis TaxID=161448 RepID=UPI0025A4DAA7|nr:interleukin-1 receptor-like 2 isoform X1 [Corythoichthys intestinalis]
MNEILCAHSQVMCVRVRALLLASVLMSVGWTHADHDKCRNYGVRFERVFSVPGDAAMMNCTLASPEVFNVSSTSYWVEWYRAETGQRLSNVSRGVLLRGETLWLLNVTKHHDGYYQCVIRTSSSGCYKLSTRLVVDVPVHGECGRPRTSSQVITVGVTDTLSCPVKDVLNELRSYGAPASVTWYRGCDRIEDGSDKHVYRDGARLKIRDVDSRCNGSYTCTVNFNLGGAAASVSETVEVWVQEDYCFEPQVLQPANEIVKAAPGSRLTRTCQVFVPCIGTVPEHPMVDVLWLDDFGMISTDNSKRIFASQTRVWRTAVPRKGVWLENMLTISSVEEADFLLNLTCRAYSARGLPQARFVVRPQEPDASVPVGCSLGGAAALIVVALVVYLRFKIDIVLFFRSSFPFFYENNDCDGKAFDAYVMSFDPLNCQPNVSEGVRTFAHHILPQVLEKACGYKLFITGRDCLPGQAMVDSVHDNMKASRRLLLLYGASSFTGHNKHPTNNNNNETPGEDACPDPRSQHECALAMHQALMEGTLKVVLVELEEVSATQLAVFPESLRHLRKKQGAVCWWKNSRRLQHNHTSWTTCTRKGSPSGTGAQEREEADSAACLSPSSRFWKEIRYHMPVRGKRIATPEKTHLMKV